MFMRKLLRVIADSSINFDKDIKLDANNNVNIDKKVEIEATNKVNIDNEVKITAPTLDPANLLEFYWNFYNHSAEQRIKNLNNYVLVIIAMFAGSFMVCVADITAFDKHLWNLLLFSGMFIISEVCFWLDIRSTNQLHHCRKAFRSLEKSIKDENQKIFTMMNTASKKGNDGKYDEPKKLNYQSILTYVYRGVELIAICWVVSMVLYIYSDLTSINSETMNKIFQHAALTLFFGGFILCIYINWITNYVGGNVRNKNLDIFTVPGMRIQQVKIVTMEDIIEWLCDSGIESGSIKSLLENKDKIKKIRRLVHIGMKAEEIYKFQNSDREKVLELVLKWNDFDPNVLNKLIGQNLNIDEIIKLADRGIDPKSLNNLIDKNMDINMIKELAEN